MSALKASDGVTSRDAILIGGQRVAVGERRDIEFEVTEGYSGLPVVVPITVWRAAKPGPTVLVTAAVHGDELNGTGIVREILLSLYLPAKPCADSMAKRIHNTIVAF